MEEIVFFESIEKTLEDFYQDALKASKKDDFYEAPVFPGNLSQSRVKFFNNAAFFWYWDSEHFDVAGQNEYTELFFSSLPLQEQPIWVSVSNILKRINDGEKDLTDPEAAKALEKDAQRRAQDEQRAAHKAALIVSQNLVNAVVSLSILQGVPRE